MFIFPVGRFKVSRIRKLKCLLPELVFPENIEEALSPIIRTAPSTEFVVFGVTRQFGHVFRKVQGIVDSADKDQVSNQPLVVVSEVVNLIGQHPVPHHVGVVNTG